MIDYYETKSQPITREMVWRAYHKVKANQGSAGIDRMNWEYLDKNLSTELYKLWNRLSSGSYFPLPVKQVAIAKKDGGVRNLGIPTLLDRIAQEVVNAHLEPTVEPLFHNSSFGYRPNRSCHDAVAAAQGNTYNHDFAIDLDIKGFFDSIDHELLLKGVRHYCKDKWVLMYVERWLKAGILKQDGSFHLSEQGTPQGGVISPLLANIFLHVVFDKWLEKQHPEKPFERYADDIIVHCKTEKQALFMLRAISKRLTACKLLLHPDKTRIVNVRGTAEKKYSKGYDFLGFTIRPNWVKFKEKSKVVPSTFVSTKSKKNILGKFKSLEIHKRRKPLTEIAKELNPIIRGLINYFHKFEDGQMRYVWNQLNHRLLKWVKWEKGLYKKAAVAWLKLQYKENPGLFHHWQLAHP
jgi:group II intron reverse transcriptase/maturase